MSSFFDDDAAVEPLKKRLHREETRFTGEVPHSTNESDNDEDGDDVPVLAPSGGRVGVKLLESMHHDHQQQQQPPIEKGTTASSSRKMRVVGSYMPLSVGGFMESTSEAVEEHLSVQTGSVMCVRCPQKLLSKEGEAPPSSDKEHSQKSGILFVKEADLSAEERLYGKSLTSDMATEIFEVGRVDRVTNSLEAIFLDGTRQKLKFTAVRPAGFVERELFRKWKSDPSSRPVRIIHTEDAKKKKSTTGAASSAPSHSSSAEEQHKAAQQPSVPWWVVPQLIVRVVEESAGDMCGKKFIVRTVLRKERRIRLEPWRSDSHAASVAPHESVDIIGCEALETVLPKVGERGMVVLGAMRGELVTVAARHRNTDGEVAALQVTSTRNGSAFTVEPQELCQLEIMRKGSNVPG